jgi:hypothetical protein
LLICAAEAVDGMLQKGRGSLVTDTLYKKGYNIELVDELD